MKVFVYRAMIIKSFSPKSAESFLKLSTALTRMEAEMTSDVMYVESQKWWTDAPL